MVNEKPNLTFGSGQLPTPNVQRRAGAPQISNALKTAKADFAALLSRVTPLKGAAQEETAAAETPKDARESLSVEHANFSTPLLKAPPMERSRRITTPLTGRGNFEMIDTRHGPGGNLPVLNSPNRPQLDPETLKRVLESSKTPLAVVNSLPEKPEAQAAAKSAAVISPEQIKTAFKAPKVLTPPSRRAAPSAEVFSFNSPFAVGPSAGELVSIFRQVKASASEPAAPYAQPYEQKRAQAVRAPSAPVLENMVAAAREAGNLPAQEAGSLSARYESGSEGIAAIGYDRHGGTSYGKYQISSRAGTMNRFLDYLDTRAPDLATRLRESGPANTGGRSGRMPNTWKEIAAEDPTRFEALQSDFIRDSHYEPALVAMTESSGLSYAAIPPALQEVLFSTAVQHGPVGAAGIINQAVAKVGADRLRADASEEERLSAGRELITAIYNARAGKFGSSTRQVRTAVQQRLRQEMSDALAMLD